MAKTKKLQAFPKLHLFNRQKDLPLSMLSVRRAIGELFSFLKISHTEMGCYFVSQKKISFLHEKFFQDPSPTDCISFPLDEEHLGEIFVCPKTALAFAKTHGKNPFEETLLYIVHGLLHLIGFDDLSVSQRKAMRKKEKECMAYLMQQGISLDPSSF